MGSDGRSMGCGIVEYATSDDARNAIATLHDTELKGRLLSVRQDRDDVKPMRQLHQNGHGEIGM